MSSTRIFTNGKIYTVNKSHPWAQAVVLEDEKIAYVGDNEGALAYKKEGAQIQDLDGKMMLPGFIDGHIHPLMSAAFRSGIQLQTCKDEAAIVEAVRQYVEANPDKETYFGHGFRDEIFADYHPTTEVLDAVCPDKPLLLVASSCHGAWCNKRALEVAGIDKNTPDITPGSNYFVRDERGNPTGRCIESCYIQVAKGANYFPREVFKKSLLGLSEDFAKLGYTSFVDCGVYSFVVESLDGEFAKWINSNEYPQRIFGGFYLATSMNELEECIEGATDLVENLENTDKLAFTFFKILGDGVLESKSAAFVDPYDDGNLVVPNFNSEQAKQIGLLVAKHGYDLNMHAIGSKTCMVALDMLEAIREAGYSDTRMAISHCECWQRDQVERAGRLGAFINSTGVWHVETADDLKRLYGANVEGPLYPIKSLIEAGCKYGQGSDFPVAAGAPNALASIEVGMRRANPGQTQTDRAEMAEAPSLEESIESFTINNAYEIRMEDKLGSIEVGKLADLVILDKNLFDIPVEDIHTTQIVETIMNGKTTYKKQ
jgi:predicted amidohydrolase YtcJ